MKRGGRILVSLLICMCGVPALAIASAPPSIEPLTPSPVRNHDATVRYAIDPEGLETTYRVEHGLSAGNYFVPWQVFTKTLPAGSEPVVLSTLIPAWYEQKLAAETEYHWRVIAENSAGVTVGPDRVFTTTNGPAAVPINKSATEQTLTSARLEATVDPEGVPLTACRFRYVSEQTHHMKGWVYVSGRGDQLFGLTVPCEESLAEIGSGSAPVTVHANLSGLEPLTYRYVLEVDNQYEEDVDWWSPASNFGPPSVYGQMTADPVGATTATLTGALLKGRNVPLQYRVEYKDGGEWQGTGWVEPALGKVEQPVAAWLDCLQPETEYTYRLVATNVAGTVYGPEQTFTTAGGEPDCLPPPTWSQSDPPATGAQPSPPQVGFLPTLVPTQRAVPFPRSKRSKGKRNKQGKHRKHRRGGKPGRDRLRRAGANR